MSITIKSLQKPETKRALKRADLFNEQRRSKDILKTMDEDTYEEMVASWAYWCLKENDGRRYEDVMRIGGGGDKGVDVIAYYDQEANKCDIYQCKHYNHAVRRSDIIAELGKFLYFMSIGDLPVPESYYLMAPQDLSSRFLHIYGQPDKLKNAITDSWDKDIAGHIEKGKQYLLEGDLKAFVEAFDYTRFKTYSSDKFLETLVKSEQRFVYFQYFGYRKEHLKRIKKDTPATLDEYEKRYIEHLMDAYNDVEGEEVVDTENVSDSSFGAHFGRSRDEFWLAESVKKMGEENCPGDEDEFEELKDDMEGHVADTYEGDYKDAYERVKAVTKTASTMPKKDRIISGELGPRELKGVCYQLSNEDRLIWKKEGKS